MCVCASLLLERHSSPADEVLHCPITRSWLCATDVIFMVMGLISLKVRGVVCVCVCVCVCARARACVCACIIFTVMGLICLR